MKLRLRSRLRLLVALALAAGLAAVGGAGGASAASSYVRISGSGSTWAYNAVFDWQTAVRSQGVVVDFDPVGSSSGRQQFAKDLVDYTVSEIPYKGDTADPQDTSSPDFGYTMMPMVAGGTSFMYNLPIGGQLYQNLKLSMPTLAGIFSGQITRWNDPAIAADNPGVTLPAQRITVVVRSEGSGATAQFTLWMLRQFPDAYKALCAKTGCNPGAATSYYPYNGLPNFVAQNGSSTLTTYVTNTPYTIGYDEYSYALQANFPVAQIKNAAGFYTVPSDGAVAVALTQAQINTDQSSQNYLSQDLTNVYTYQDPRTYPLSAYSYFMVPTQQRTGFTAAKGATLGFFTQYSLCEGQRTMGALGFSPLPMNLVLAALDQVSKIPGIDSPTQEKIAAVKSGTLTGGSNPCNNPTFQPGDSPSHNVLVDTAKFPDGCDAACQAPWRTAAAGDAASGPNQGGTTAPAKSGTGTGAGTGTSTGGGTGSGATKPCTKDPDTGACLDGTGGDAVAASSVRSVATVIDRPQDWTLPIVIAIAMLAALVFGPSLVMQLAGRRRR